MADKGKIVYRFETPIYPGRILYVNLIQNYSCTNDCVFCSRPRRKNDFGKGTIYEKKAGTSLYLEKSPSVEEVMKEIEKQIKPNDEEIAIIGLGEPLIYFDKVRGIIKQIKKKYKIKIRVDTNGVAPIIIKNPEESSKKLKEAGLDEARISLNATNKEDYNRLCKPSAKNAFEKLQEFIRSCIKEGIETKVSFVVNFKDKNHNKVNSEKTSEEYKNFAKSLGVDEKNIIFRDYILPLKSN